MSQPDVHPADIGETRPRFRISVKQTAKGAHQFDATVEYPYMLAREKRNPQDIGDEQYAHIGEILLHMLKETEDAFRLDGREIVVKRDPIQAVVQYATPPMAPQTPDGRLDLDEKSAKEESK